MLVTIPFALITEELKQGDGSSAFSLYGTYRSKHRQPNSFLYMPLCGGKPLLRPVDRVMAVVTRAEKFLEISPNIPSHMFEMPASYTVVEKEPISSTDIPPERTAP